MRKSSWRRLLCAFLFCLTAKVAAAQELANLLPEDILGLISLSPVAKARDNIDALSDFLSLPELRNALSTRMGHIFLDENLTAVDTTRGLGLVMLNPQEFNFPYAVVVPVTDFENFVRACAVDSKVYPFSQGNQDLFFARLGEGRIFFGRIPGCAIVSVNQKAVRKIMRAGYFGEKRLYESLSQIERQNLETNPIAFYFNMRMVTESSEGALDTAKFEMLEMAMTETSASKPADGGFQEFSRMQLDCLFALLKEVKSVSGSLKIETDGVRAMVDVTPVSQGPLETLLKSAVGGDVEDYRGLIGKETFAALSWRTDGQAVRNFSVDIARNLATEEARQKWKAYVNRHVGMAPAGVLCVEQGEKAVAGFKLPGLLYAAAVKQAARGDWDSVVNAYASLPLVKVKPASKKINDKMYDTADFGAGPLTLQATYGYVEDRFFMAFNQSDIRLTAFLGAVEAKKLPAMDTDIAALGKLVEIPPNLFFTASPTTILRMVIRAQSAQQPGAGAAERPGMRGPPMERPPAGMPPGERSPADMAGMGPGGEPRPTGPGGEGPGMRPGGPDGPAMRPGGPDGPAMTPGGPVGMGPGGDRPPAGPAGAKPSDDSSGLAVPIAIPALVVAFGADGGIGKIRIWAGKVEMQNMGRLFLALRGEKTQVSEMPYEGQPYMDYPPGGPDGPMMRREGPGAEDAPMGAQPRDGPRPNPDRGGPPPGFRDRPGPRGR